MEPFDVDTLRTPERLAALRRTALLDETSSRAFDRLTRLASTALDVPIALVSLVGADHQRFASCVGVGDLEETPLSHSFCKHVVATTEPLVVTDAREDPRLQGNLAIEDLQVIAYAGFPLRTSDGHVLGSFCAIDTAPRAWTDRELAIVADLAEAALEVLELRTSTLAAVQQAERNAGFAAVGRRLQRALVPRVPTLAHADVHAVYQPGERRLLVGGDLHHVAERPDGGTSVLVGDVAGHGAEAAAFAAGLRAAWAALLPDDALDLPGRMARLNAVALEQQPDEATFATAVAVELAADGTHAAVVSAGHPPPIAIARDDVRALDVPPGPPVGVRSGVTWRACRHALAGHALLLHTDGLVEGRARAGSSERLGTERLLALLAGLRADGLERGALLEALVDRVLRLNGGAVADDLAAVIVTPLIGTSDPA